MTQKLPSKSTMQIRAALNDLLKRNQTMTGFEAGEMYLGPDFFVAHLKRPQIIEGDWSEVGGTMDLFDLMNQHQREEKERPRPRREDRNRSSGLLFPH